jgi:hypothetical protein
MKQINIPQKLLVNKLSKFLFKEINKNPIKSKGKI